MKYDTREFLCTSPRGDRAGDGGTTTRAGSDGKRSGTRRHPRRWPAILAATAAARRGLVPVLPPHGDLLGVGLAVAAHRRRPVRRTLWEDATRTSTAGWWAGRGTAVPGLLLAWDGLDGQISVATYLAGLVFVADRGHGMAWPHHRGALDAASWPSTPMCDDEEPSLDLFDFRGIPDRAGGSGAHELTRYQYYSIFGEADLDLAPLGAEIGTTEGRTKQVLPLTMPEIVAAFRTSPGASPPASGC